MIRDDSGGAQWGGYGAGADRVLADRPVQHGHRAHRRQPDGAGRGGGGAGRRERGRQDHPHPGRGGRPHAGLRLDPGRRAAGRPRSRSCRQAGGQDRLAGSRPDREPRRGVERDARQRETSAYVLRRRTAQGGGPAVREARHPAAGHHAADQGAVRRPAADGGGRPGDGPQPPAAAARRADRLARHAGGGAGRAAHHPAPRAGHHDPAVLPRHRADVPAVGPDRGAAARPGGDRGDHRRGPPGRRDGADRGPGGRLLGPPAADPAARADRAAGLVRPVLEPVADLVRARRGPGQRAALHPPGRRGAADQDRVLRGARAAA